MGSSYEHWNLDGGSFRGSSKGTKFGRTAHTMSSTSLRKRSNVALVSKVRWGLLRQVLDNLQEVVLGTKLSILFSAIPLVIVAQSYNFGSVWVFVLSLLGLVPLAERLSFLTEQIAFYTGPTVGGLLNATCGNVTELIIALFALHEGKIEVLKCSLLGSVLSNLLLVLGTSLFCGGLVNLGKEQKYDRKQADVNTGLLFLGLLCHMLPLMFKHSMSSSTETGDQILQLSRVSSIVMLLSYIAFLFFQLKTHREFFEAQEEEVVRDVLSEEEPVIGFSQCFFAWLVVMTAVTALLSDYVVGTIEDASKSWGVSVSFSSIILLPIVGNATEHAGAVIFAIRDKLDISLGVAAGFFYSNCHVCGKPFHI
ncbi:Sodium/calcium exchanger membrane region [Cinnamomum micranthum f. kanehirae]|uniref:Vacuolar cation/proton exchanger n=1 Tax=Cinnamomum micranthum f. kanehirae TaxID=337451 RepID=A0A443PN01_9MAGN|nr:Sodium/calcium exchanger membrane region [Cinnamomum micranthum f. kanehirae]